VGHRADVKAVWKRNIPAYTGRPVTSLTELSRAIIVDILTGKCSFPVANVATEGTLL